MKPDVDTTRELLEDLRQRYADLLQRFEGNQAELHRLARSVYQVQEAERRRVALELHDGLGQNLTALKNQLSLATTLLSPEQTEVRSRLEAALELCADTLTDTRELSRLLRPQVLDDFGLEAALHWLARTLAQSSTLQIETHVDPIPPLDHDVQTVLFRIAQEALGNTLRHSGAREAMVKLGVRSGWLRLTVWDDGAGFDVDAALAAASRGQSSGLAGMRERAMLYGGKLSIESGGGGTWLRVALPEGILHQ